jgi:hypothetical protein
MQLKLYINCFPLNYYYSGIICLFKGGASFKHKVISVANRKLANRKLAYKKVADKNSLIK